ncbi:MAG: zinc ribbon domain-containing protein [Dehalococcoidales bacterium]|nr:zinc ribbon domain-containing protein [Dehalococcoidales bacterium]
MPICLQCGNKVNAEDKFCFSCGAELQEPVKTLQQQLESLTEEREKERQERERWESSYKQLQETLSERDTTAQIPAAKRPEKEEVARGDGFWGTVIAVSVLAALIAGLIGFGVGRSRYQGLQAENDDLMVTNDDLLSELQSVKSQNDDLVRQNDYLRSRQTREPSSTVLTPELQETLDELAALRYRYTSLDTEYQTLLARYNDLLSRAELRRFRSYGELKTWVDSKITKEESISGKYVTPSELYAKALELQTVALKDGFIISAVYGQIPGSRNWIESVYCTAQTDDALYWWIPGKNEIKPTFYPK